MAASMNERAAVRREARDLLGADWLATPNARLGGLTPDQAIDDGRVDLVRDILESIKHAGVS